MSERLEEIKEHVKKIESTLYDKWQRQELTNLIESLYYADHVDWLINRVEELELEVNDLVEKSIKYRELLSDIANLAYYKEQDAEYYESLLKQVILFARKALER